MKRTKRSLGAGLLFLLAAAFLAGCSVGMTGRADSLAEEPLPSLTDVMAEEGRVWRYTDDPVRLAEITDDSWTKPGFDDSGWLEGAGAFGAKDGLMQELDGGYRPDVCLRQYLPSGGDIPAYFFRLRFTAEAGDRLDGLSVSILYDDAAIVYLNGEQIFSVNVPEGGYDGPNAYGSANVLGGPSQAAFRLDGSLLREGENVLAVELHQDDRTSSDIYFRMPEMTSDLMKLVDLREDTLCLGVGSDASQVLAAWQGGTGGGSLLLAPWSPSPDWERSEAFQAEAVYDNGDGTCAYRAVLDGLAPGEYAYRVDDGLPAQTHRFTAAGEQEPFFFLCGGDPQIGDDNDPEPMEIYEDLAAWAMEGQTPAFILSLGDQSNDADDPALFRRYVSTPLLKTLPLAALVGNHENGADQFSRFFFLPNMDENTVDSSGDMSGDYWFFRNDTLFLCLNSSNDDVDAHRQFMLDAVGACAERYGEPRWTVAAMHHSLFSAGGHTVDDTALERRETYPEAFEAAGVDVVFAGHDHSYARSWPMDGAEPVAGGTSEDGIVYFTLSSSTGTKFYDLYEDEPDYLAFSDGSERPCMTRVDVTDEAMTITTYCEDEGQYQVLDEYVIH